LVPGPDLMLAREADTAMRSARAVETAVNISNNTRMVIFFMITAIVSSKELILFV